MSKKENTTVKIKCDSPEAAGLVIGYIESVSSELTRNINSFLAKNGKGATDATLQNVDREKLTMEIVVRPTDKGDVLVLGEDGALSVAAYTELENEELYGYFDASRLYVYERIKDEGAFDKKIADATSFTMLAQALEELPKFIAEYKEQAKAQAAAASASVVRDMEVIESDVSEDDIPEKPVDPAAFDSPELQPTPESESVLKVVPSE